MLKTADLLDLVELEHAEVFDGCPSPWEALDLLEEFLRREVELIDVSVRIQGNVSPHAFVAADVVIGSGTTIDPGAVIYGPTVIGRDCHVRANAYIRGSLLAGDSCVLGNACEFKNAILFNAVQVPHLSYVGDSILGYAAHLGAGVKLSNFKSLRGDDHETVKVRTDNGPISTGLQKFGAIIGDHADIGCNCVLNPGSIIGRRSVLYPGVSWRGICPADRVVKLLQQHSLVERR